MELLSTQAAAKLLGMTPDAVRYHERKGHIHAFRVERGSDEPMRLFVREDVEKFVLQRAQKRAAKAAVAVDQEAQ
jgi:DNA-binding transcriptional MerR regulator